MLHFYLLKHFFSASTKSTNKKMSVFVTDKKKGNVQSILKIQRKSQKKLREKDCEKKKKQKEKLSIMLNFLRFQKTNVFLFIYSFTFAVFSFWFFSFLNKVLSPFFYSIFHLICTKVEFFLSKTLEKNVFENSYMLKTIFLSWKQNQKNGMDKKFLFISNDNDVVANNIGIC